MRYVSDRFAQLFFLCLGLGAVGLAVEGLLRSAIRVVGRRAIVVVRPHDAVLYWGFETFYLLAGTVTIVYAIKELGAKTRF